MKLREEIEHKLEQLELQLEAAKEWSNSAYERYREDKKNLGRS